jgi:hypothetical protein
MKIKYRFSYKITTSSQGTPACKHFKNGSVTFVYHYHYYLINIINMLWKKTKVDQDNIKQYAILKTRGP